MNAQCAFALSRIPPPQTTVCDTEQIRTLILSKVMIINATFHRVHNQYIWHTFGTLLRTTHGNYANLPIYIYIKLDTGISFFETKMRQTNT